MAIEWLTIKDVENIYKISASMQSKLRMKSSGSNFPFYKIGTKYIRYDRAEIDEWIKSNGVPATHNKLTDKQRVDKTVNSLLTIYGNIE